MALVFGSIDDDWRSLSGSLWSYCASVVPEGDRKEGFSDVERKLRGKVLITKCVRRRVTSKIKVTTQTIVSKGFISEMQTRG